jgi:capsular polysaccharide biosynthesis protein
MDAPDLPAKPTFPDRLKFGLSGLALGLALGVGLALLIEYRENFIRTEDDVVRILALPVLISIPELKRQTGNIDSLPLARLAARGQADQQAKV